MSEQKQCVLLERVDFDVLGNKVVVREHGCTVRSRLEAENERLRNELTLKTAEAEAGASLLLDVQQDCIALRKALGRR